jgi:spore coat polysaccharide biosynthesis protein SpsF (cytidylyltransferase family)
MRKVAIVQARFHSSRLPGKTCLRLGDGTVLGEVLARCAMIPGIDAVCCAVADDGLSAPVAAEARRAGAIVFLGSNEDVLDRYLQAARATKADIVLRVTSDCPLIDPELSAEVLARLAESGADYASNNMPPGFPHGLDCEAFTIEALLRADAASRDKGEREHVTPWLRNAAGIRRASLVGPGGGLAEQRWTVDWPEDYLFVHALFERLGGMRPAWREVAELVASEPGLATLNAMRVDRGRLPLATQEKER